MIYNVGYWSYEEAPEWLLECETIYTQSEFDELVANCYKEAYINSDDKDKNTIEELIEDVILLLINKYKFTEIKANISFRPFGWASVLDNDWEDCVNDQLNLIRSKFKK